MWENMTYEAILADALSRVPSDVDKREGSVIYDALAPCCYKLAEYYSLLDNFADLVLADTAVGKYLDRIVDERNLKRKQATAAVRKVTTNEAVTIGSRWAINDIVYDITALISDNVYSATCETAGTVGNVYTGQLSNIDNTSDATAILSDIITAGTDEESDEALRARYMAKVRSPATSGNPANYKQWALEVDGCGGAKVIPLWNGNGTVKLLVVDDNMDIDPALPAKVYDHIVSPDNPELQLSPIGAALTVESPAGLSISVTANIKLDGSQTLEQVQAAFVKELAAYLKSSIFVAYSVSYAKIGALLLSTPGVLDYDALKVNGDSENITVPDDEIPVIGTVTLTEVTG
ncbi:MAG: Baseplate-J domain-containing protein [Eubacteriales bacterium]|jgi:uncharacterized phage protein gp47/JayE